MSAADDAGHVQHELIGCRVRDIACGGEGALMAVTHEMHDHGRVVDVAHIRPASGVEWSTALGNVRPSRVPVSGAACPVPFEPGTLAPDEAQPLPD